MSDLSAISRLAYELWEKGGRREGTAEQNWLEAERILASRGRAPLTAQAVDQLLTAPAPAPARARKAPAKKTTTKTTAKASKRAPAEPRKVSSRDAPGG